MLGLDAAIAVAIITGVSALIKSIYDNRRWREAQQELNRRSLEERKLMFRCHMLELRLLHKENLNGEVDTALNDLNEFLLHASH